MVFRLGWSFVWAGLSFGLVFRLGYSQSLSDMTFYPYSCTEIYRATVGTHSQKVYDYFVVLNGSQKFHVFPYYITNSVSGVAIISGNSMYEIYPNVPQNLSISDIHFHTALSFQNTAILAGGVAFQNGGYGLGMMGFSSASGNAVYRIFRLPNANAYSFLHLISSTSNGNGTMVLAGGATYLQRKIGVIVKSTFFPSDILPTSGTLFSIEKQDWWIEVTNVEYIDSVYFVVHLYAKSNVTKETRLIVAVISDKMEIVDTVSIMFNGYSSFSINDAEVLWEDLCTKRVVGAGYVCSYPVEFSCFNNSADCYGLGLSYLLKPVPDSTVFYGYRWDIIGIDWLKAYGDSSFVNNTNRKPLHFLEDVYVYNSHNRQFGIMVGTTNEICSASEARWAGWILKIDFSTGDLLKGWAYVLKNIKNDPCPINFTKPTMELGYFLKGYDHIAGTIGGMLIRNIPTSQGYDPKCSASNEIVMLKPLIKGAFPPKVPICCDMKSDVFSSGIQWNHVATPPIQVRKLGSTLDYFSLLSNVVPLTINCSGTIRQKPDIPDINLE